MHAIVEGDSEIIFKDLINFEPSQGLHSHLIEDIKLLASHFSCINFPHVRRQGNVVHTLSLEGQCYRSFYLFGWKMFH